MQSLIQKRFWERSVVHVFSDTTLACSFAAKSLSVSTLSAHSPFLSISVQKVDAKTASEVCCFLRVLSLLLRRRRTDTVLLQEEPWHVAAE